jgi:hypothetical protein
MKLFSINTNEIKTLLNQKSICYKNITDSFDKELLQLFKMLWRQKYNRLNISEFSKFLGLHRNTIYLKERKNV